MRIGVCVALTLFASTGFAQSEPGAWTENQAISSARLVRADPDGANAPLLQSVVSLDLKDAKIRTALRVMSNQMGGRLMYDESVSNLPNRVTIQHDQINASRALREILAGTDVEIFVSQGGQLVLLKRVPRIAPLVDPATVRGRVVDAASRDPIARVSVRVGERMGAMTNDQGVFVVPNVPAGTYTMTFQRIGYAQKTQSITLRDGQDTTLVVPMNAVASKMETIVSTGSIDRTAREVGYKVTTLNVDSVMQASPVTNMSDLLANRVPGLEVTKASGAVGAPSRLRLDGFTSLENDNSPLVILDGIRISTKVNQQSGASYGQGVLNLGSRLDDIDPNTIESIQVLRGPSASSLYGSEAANGVIILRSKRGKAGPAQWTFGHEYRLLAISKDMEYPRLQEGYPITGSGSQTPNCTPWSIDLGSCLPIDGKYVGFNMLQDPRFTPQANGYSQKTTAAVSGGVADLTYFLTGSFLDQLGTAKMPDVNVNYITTMRGDRSMPQVLKRPNAQNQWTANGRLSGRIGQTADFTFGTQFISRYQRVGPDGMSGLVGSTRYASDTTPVTTGWDGWNVRRSQSTKRTINNIALNWQPMWGGRQILSGAALYGLDFNLSDDESFVPRGSCQPLCNGTSDQGINGYVQLDRRSELTHTGRVNGMISLPLYRDIARSQSVVQLAMNKKTYYDFKANADNLNVGRKFTSASGNKYIYDTGDQQITANVVFEENVLFRGDKMLLNFGFTQEAVSSLGDETKKPLYPKFNTAWTISEERFFPFKEWMPLLRLNGAFGIAGTIPSSTARLRTYAMGNNYVLDNDSPTGAYAELGSPGNTDLRPEQTKEYEGGFDMELFDQRIALGMLWVHKKTFDGIQRMPVAGSVGASVVRTFFKNMGDFQNDAFTFEWMARVLDNDIASYQFSGSLNRQRNLFVRLDPGVVSFISLSASGDLYTGNDSRTVVGYPLYGRWAYPILGWADVNKDGRINRDEVRVGDSLVYVGPTQAPWTAQFGNTVSLFKRRLTVNGNFAWSSGLTQFNEQRKTMASGGRVGVTSSLQDQACIQATVASGSRRATDWCFMETVKVLRLQNLSMTYAVHPHLLKYVGAKSAAVTFSGTNMGLWTNFHGMDPSINSTGVDGNAMKAGTVFPAPHEYGMSVQLHY